MLYTEEHDEIKQMVRDFVDSEINPYADEWEEAKSFPAHEVLFLGLLFLIVIASIEVETLLGIVLIHQHLSNYKLDLDSDIHLHLCQDNQTPM